MKKKLSVLAFTLAIAGAAAPTFAQQQYEVAPEKWSS